MKKTQKNLRNSSKKALSKTRSELKGLSKSGLNRGLKKTFSKTRSDLKGLQRSFAKTSKDVKGQVVRAQRQVSTYVKKNPMATIGVSIGVSMLAGALIGQLGRLRK